MNNNNKNVQAKGYHQNRSNFENLTYLKFFKYTFLLLSLVGLSSITYTLPPCQTCPCLRQAARQAVQQEQYVKAIKKYNAAHTCEQNAANS